VKPATAYAVAAAAIDWEDRRADRIKARRVRASAFSKAAEEFGDDGDLTEATADEHAAYMAAVKAEKSARQRMRAQCKRARAEIEQGKN